MPLFQYIGFIRHIMCNDWIFFKVRKVTFGPVIDGLLHRKKPSIGIGLAVFKVAINGKNCGFMQQNPYRTALD